MNPENYLDATRGDMRLMSKLKSHLLRRTPQLTPAILKWMAESPSTRDPRLFLYIWRHCGLFKALGFRIYDDKFYADHVRLEKAYADLASIIKSVFSPESVCDVGCGNAFIINHLKQSGVRVKGIEGSRDVLPYIPAAVRSEVLIGSVTQPFCLGTFDLVVSMEVAEHIPKAKSAILVKNLVQHARASVLFTAAAPGQWGDGHINCQPKSYWERLFCEQGWCVNENLQTEVLLAIRQRPPINELLPWISRNLMVLTPCCPETCDAGWVT